jgi:ABC-type nitrate/sulfonate/bicarbonate transport system substrate-binding protein
MKTIKVGGVPEHFNLPWHLCIEDGDFEYENIKVDWHDCYGGTGEMTTALRNGDLDVAIILTEGIIKDIIDGNPSRIVQTYVDSPLIWGIHVAHNSKFNTLTDLQYTKAAISRIGSGSQLMTYVNAQNNGWNLSNLQFEIVGNLDGAIKALTGDKAQYFMWEHFTTKPWVDSKIFRSLGTCPTPWPCFVIAVRDDFLENNVHDIKKMLDVINVKTASFKEVPKIEETLALRYDQKLEDIREWMNLTSWSQFQLPEEELEQVQDYLKDLKLISKKISGSKIISNLEDEII